MIRSELNRVIPLQADSQNLRVEVNRVGDTVKMPNGADAPEMGFIAGMSLLLARGFLLWFVLPPTFLWWLLGLPFWRKRAVKFAQLIGWADLNLIACLERGPLRLCIHDPLKWIPLSQVSQVDHTVNLLELM